MTEPSERQSDQALSPRTETSAAPGSGGFLHPEKAIGTLDLRPGMIVADFGCGGGYFSIPAARARGGNRQG